MHSVANPRIHLCALLALMILSLPVFGGPPEVKKHDDGWYKQRFKSVGIAYLVDSIGRSCYAATSGGMTEITCRSLKRRPEWAAIIKWERKIKTNY